MILHFGAFRQTYRGSYNCGMWWNQWQTMLLFLWRCSADFRQDNQWYSQLSWTHSAVALDSQLQAQLNNGFFKIFKPCQPMRTSAWGFSLQGASRLTHLHSACAFQPQPQPAGHSEDSSLAVLSRENVSSDHFEILGPANALDGLGSNKKQISRRRRPESSHSHGKRAADAWRYWALRHVGPKIASRRLSSKSAREAAETAQDPRSIA